MDSLKWDGFINQHDWDIVADGVTILVVFPHKYRF